MKAFLTKIDGSRTESGETEWRVDFQGSDGLPANGRIVFAGRLAEHLAREYMQFKIAQEPAGCPLN